MIRNPTPWHWERLAPPPWHTPDGYALRDAEGRILARVEPGGLGWSYAPAGRPGTVPLPDDVRSAEAAMRHVSGLLQAEHRLATILHLPEGEGARTIVPVSLAPGREARVNGYRVRVLALAWIPSLDPYAALRGLVHHPQLHRAGEAALAYGCSEALSHDWPLNLNLFPDADLDAMALLIREARRAP